MERRRWRSAVAAGVALLAALLTTGCQAATVGSNDAWAEVFRSTADQATTEVERSALEDGKITDQEYAYFQTRILDCLESIGVDAHWDDDGSLVYDPNGVDNDAIDECYVGNGARLLALRDAVIRNPDHLDQSAILLDCLRRVGLVGNEYTVDDLNAGLDMERLQASDDFGGCVADPLHHE